MRNWDDLRLFLAAARSGSSRGAARALGLNQSTVSRRLSQLEEQQGVRLFERRARGLELTEPGQEIVEAAEEIEQRFSVLDRKILGRDTRLSGRIHLSVPDFMVAPLGPILAGFARLYPAIQTEVMVDNGIVSLSKLEADVVLRLGPGPPEHLVGRRIAGMAVGVYGAEPYVREREDPDDLPNHAWVRWGEHWRRIPPERWIQEHVPPPNIRAVLNTNDAIVELIGAGIGVAFQPCFVGDADPRLRRVGPRFDFGLAMWLLTHEDIRRTTRIATFMKFVGDELSKDRRKMEGPYNDKPPKQRR